MCSVAWPITQAVTSTLFGLSSTAFVPAYLVRVFFQTVYLVNIIGRLIFGLKILSCKKIKELHLLGDLALNAYNCSFNQCVNLKLKKLRRNLEHLTIERNEIYLLENFPEFYPYLHFFHKGIQRICIVLEKREEMKIDLEHISLLSH